LPEEELWIKRTRSDPEGFKSSRGAEVRRANPGHEREISDEGKKGAQPLPGSTRRGGGKIKSKNALPLPTLILPSNALSIEFS